MNITPRHLSVTIFIAVLLHAGVVTWFSWSEQKLPLEPIKPLRVNLLATIAETTMLAAEPVKPEPVKPEPVKPEPVKPEPVKPEPVKPEPVKPEPVKPEPVKPEPVKPEPVKPEPVKPAQDIIKEQTNPSLEPRPDSKAKSIEKDIDVQNAIATARYEQLLVAWLEKHKKYPRRAKRLRIEGEGRLRIRINHKGNMLKVSLIEPTGNRFLDKAALEMAQRANPFPAMPEDDLRHEMDFIVPVVFLLY